MPECAAVRLPAIPADFADLERTLFASINAVVEPKVLAGWGAPGLVPAGVVVLETTGRVSGAVRRVPVLAARLGDYVVVATFRGRRSQWVKNLAATPRMRYWSGGVAQDARAFVFDGENEVPRKLRWLQSALAPSVALGWAFAVLAPAAKARARGGDGKRAARKTRSVAAKATPRRKGKRAVRRA